MAIHFPRTDPFHLADSTVAVYLCAIHVQQFATFQFACLQVALFPVAHFPFALFRFALFWFALIQWDTIPWVNCLVAGGWSSMITVHQQNGWHNVGQPCTTVQFTLPSVLVTTTMRRIL